MKVPEVVPFTWYIGRIGVNSLKRMLHLCRSSVFRSKFLLSHSIPRKFIQEVCGKQIKINKQAFSSLYLLCNRREDSVQFGAVYMSHSSSARCCQIRLYSSGRKWYESKELVSKLKTGALVVLGTGAVLASTTFAFGFFVLGAFGFGLYSFYRRFFAPSHRNSRDIDLDSIFSATKGTRRSVYRQESLMSPFMDNMPLLVRGLLKGIFGLVGKLAQASMERANDLHDTIYTRMQSNHRIRDRLGDNFRLEAPSEWMETNVNGIGRIKAVFLVHSHEDNGIVKAKAAVCSNGTLTLKELKYQSLQTGKVIDLMQDHDEVYAPNKKTVIDAEFIDLEKNKRS
uniref:Uncharacterized protein AlNc14C400G11361 n=1 Tax=Albugo laibachii Nc14 TaxID=890382 RepID=F0WYV1_9STRA|nr:conserved hypothetical protein [Albugo laibachii Nc14]|eukprot:CCA26660.1 conserved hypothetical protein [Albugo laibachii Nc14]